MDGHKDMPTTEQKIEKGFYSYVNAETAQQAALEVERIQRLEKQIDYDKPQVVLQLYQKVISKNIFHTPEGFVYLVHLRKYLEEHKEECKEEIPGIPAGVLPIIPIDEKQMVQKSKQEATHKIDNTTPKEKLQKYKIIIGFLICAIIGMLIIAGLSDSPTILNYEKEIQNKYADWEEQLKEREEKVSEREEEVTNREEELEGK